MSKQAKIFISIVGIVVIGLVIAAFATVKQANTTNGEYIGIAKCLKAKGVIFYGAFWCPHCKAQKASFGDAVQYLPYHECSTPDANGMLASCQTAGIQEYPTWVFPDGTRLTGVQDPETLAAKAGCSATSASSSNDMTASSTSMVSTSSTSTNTTTAY